jgi:hypothetical protein
LGGPRFVFERAVLSRRSPSGSTRSHLDSRRSDLVSSERRYDVDETRSEKNDRPSSNSKSGFVNEKRPSDDSQRASANKGRTFLPW